jgi:PAS domain S-box-containing protein
MAFHRFLPRALAVHLPIFNAVSRRKSKLIVPSMLWPAEQTLTPRGNTDQLVSLFENSSLGVAIAGPAFRFLGANPAFLAMLGYSTEELRHLAFLDICSAEDRDQYRVSLHELDAGTRLQYDIQTRYQRKDGTSLPVSVYVSRVGDYAGKRQTFLLATVDITARLAAEEALHLAQLELGRVARLTTVGAMAASIAHEISQPLTSIAANGNAGLRWLTRSEPNQEEARSALERVVKEAHRAGQIIGGIRAMFRRESSERAPLAINEFVCDVVSTSLSEIKSRNISLALQLFDDLPTVQADRVQLQQVLANLLTNAIDSMASVKDRPQMLSVRSERLDDWVLISVQDSGTGIVPEQVKRVFDAFYTTKPNGIGLGLPISRSIVESHGGLLSVSPIQPHGTVFQIMLPSTR